MRYKYLFFYAVIWIGCTHQPKVKMVDDLIDHRDGHSYQCKQIGNQTWMVENLAYETKSGKSTFYASDSLNYYKYGRMYFSEDVQEAANISGWHLPDSAEWMELLKFYHLDKGVILAEKSQKEYEKWELEHLNDIVLFLSDDKNGFNYQFGGLWHQKFLRSRKFESCFEYRKQAGYYWVSLNDSKKTLKHIGAGLYKNYWIELSNNNPFHAKKSKPDLRFNIRLIKDN